MLVDTTIALLLNSGIAPTPALRTPPMSMSAAAGGVQLPTVVNPQQAALLMGPFPVLATMMREQLQQTAMNYVQGANTLMDFAMSESGGDDAMSDIAMSEVSEVPPLDEQSMGATVMVGATAAAVALMQLGRGGGGAHHQN